jgi:hypothetical protein
MNTLFPLGLAAATAFYLCLYLATLVVHLVFMHYVLAGSIYLAVGRLMGRDRGQACRWQSVLIDWLPFATGLAITAGVGPLLFVQILYGREFATANLLLSHRWMAILPVLIVCFYLLYLQKSAWIARRAWVWRPAVAAITCGGFLFIAWSWTENHLLMLDWAAWPGMYGTGSLWYESDGVLPRLAAWCFLAFPSLAIELAWQGRLLGDRLDEPAAADTRVLGLSPVQRLAVTALCGLAGTLLAAAAYWPALPDAARAAITGPLAGPWLTVAAAALLTQGVTWGITLLADRLTQGTLLVMTAAWVAALLGIAVVREAIRLAAVDLATAGELHRTALGIGGLPVFLLFAAFNAVAIGWCIRTVRGHLTGDAT